MAEAPSPLVLPPGTSPHRHDEQHRSRELIPLPSHPDPRSSLLPFHMSSPETHDSMHLAMEEHMGSPVAVTSPEFGFRTPTTTIGTGTSYGLSEDVDMHDVDGDNDNNDDDSNQQAEIDRIDPSIAAAIAKATKNFRSKCWKEFEAIVVDGVVVKGRCKHCDDMIGARRGSGTSALLNHLKRCKKRSKALKIVQDLSSTLRSPSGTRLKDWSYDPDVSRRELIRMISLHGVPFLFMEYDGFRKFVASLNPLFNVPSRTTSRNACMRDFIEKKSELQKVFKDSDCRFSLTADMWTSNQTLGYICVTCHFINSDWKLHKRIIKFIDVKTPHTGAELFSNILNCIQDWCIEDKLFGVTLDNASANDTMIGMLKRNLVDKKFLPVKGKLLHHRCAGHVINLIVKDGLKFVEPVVVNIRESVKYIRSSQSRKQMFKEIVVREGITCKKQPSLDVTTRWNSTCLMLQTALKFRNAFDSLKLEDQKYTYAPTSEEWEWANILCELLEVFVDATEVISGSQYPTSNLYFHEMWKMKLIFGKEDPGVGAEIAMVLKGMKKKFDKYWKKSYVSLCIPVVFDPRYKLKFIGFLFNDSFPMTAKKKLDRVESLVRQLFLEYSSQLNDANVDSTQQGGVNHEVCATTNDPWAAWDQQLTIDLQAQVSTELDRYLDESPIPRSKEFEILKWWMGNSSKYPILARIARDVLAIPASSVASESAFSTGERIINDFRSSLAPETVEALICLQDWYRATGSSSTEFSMASINDEVVCGDIPM